MKLGGLTENSYKKVIDAVFIRGPANQWPDPHSLAPEDEVMPLVNIGIGSEQHPAAALIRHCCASFHGARDVRNAAAISFWTVM